MSPVELGADGDTVLLIECQHEEVLLAWCAARGVVGATQRWPVVVHADWPTELAVGPGQFSRSPYSNDPTVDSSPQAVCARAELIDPNAALSELEAGYPSENYDLSISYQLETTERAYGITPSIAEVEAVLGENPSDLAIDKWLFDWELLAEADGISRKAADTSTLEWWVPEYGSFAVALSTDTARLAGPGLGAFLWSRHIPSPKWSPLIAVLRRWDTQWGAELVASWGATMLFNVEHPPSSAAQAYPLAVAHDLLADATITPAGIIIREHARALVGSKSGRCMLSLAEAATDPSRAFGG